MRRRAPHAAARASAPRTRPAPSGGPGASSARPTSSASRCAARAPRRRLAIAPVLAVIVAGLLLSPAGATVGRLITEGPGRPPRRAEPLLAALAGPDPRHRSGRHLDGRRRRLAPSPRRVAAGELVAARAATWRSSRATAWPPSTRAATSGGRSRGPRSATRAGSLPPATGSPTCRRERCG